MKTRIAIRIQLLVICLLASAIPSTALQSGDFIYTVTKGTTTITNYTSDRGVGKIARGEVYVANLRIGTHEVGRILYGGRRYENGDSEVVHEK